jgi:polyhydroxyalkanoate synthase
MPAAATTESKPIPVPTAPVAAAAPAPALHPLAAPWLNWWQAGAPAHLPPVPGVTVPTEKLLELQQDYLAQMSRLWDDFIEHPQRNAEPIRDGRFADQTWQENSLAAFLARAYLINAHFLAQMAATVDADPKTKARLCFSVSQWIDAAAPSNFLALNPKAQKRLIETHGESLTHGLQNLLEDAAKGRISQTDETAFEVGRNVATTEGAVVFENEMMQLIQYRALTPTVRQRPFLLVPPCINKYYILDLQKDNSFIRYCVERGNTVFVVSWRNPHEAQGGWGWDDYLEQGPIAAIDAVRRICGVPRINVLGFCVGGTLLAAALAVLAARGDDPAASVTLLTSLLDFTESGILDIFIDEAHVALREATLGHGGIMPGRDLANTFSSLRANDLVWNYVIHNYLEGQRPPAFDLLYWNGDSTNLPGPMYAWYLRNMYLENNLRKPGKLHCCGQPVDLGRIRVPTYVFSAREDHIVPWRGAYASAQALRGVPDGALRFVLGASGHIAGTINSPVKNRRSYWARELGPDGNESGALPEGAEQWLHAAPEHPGSWWPDWDRWLERFADGVRPAPEHYGASGFPVIEAAPGRYVKEKA